MKCVDVLLCSFLDQLCTLHRRQIYSGYSCSAVKEIIDILMDIQIQVKEFLVELFCKRDCYVKYAASKALVSFLTVIRLTTGSSVSIADVDLCSSHKLLELNTQESIPILTTIEHFYLVQSEKMPAASNFRAKQHCCAISVKSPKESMIDDTWLCSINNSTYALMSKILSSHKKWDERENWECLTRILRILVMVATKDHHMQGLLAHYHILLELLHSSSPILITNSSKILHKIIKCISKSASTTSASPARLKLIGDTLTALIKILDKVSADDREVLELRGFGGSLHLTERNVTWSYFEFQEEDGLVIQSVMLLFLSSLLFRIIDCGSTSGEQDLLKRSIVSFQTFCEKKSVDWNGSQSLLYSLYLVSLFDDQDDALMEALDYSLEISSELKRNGKEIEDLICRMWNPHSDFYFLLCSIRMDYRVILDFLMSNDTVFLLYFVKYLKLASIDKENVLLTHKLLSQDTLNIKISFNWKQSTKQKRCDEQLSFIQDRSANDSAGIEDLSVQQTLISSNTKDFASLEQIVSVCKSLSLSIEKQLELKIFPYNAKPLLNLLRNYLSVFSDTN